MAEPVSSAGDEALDEVLGRDMGVIFVISDERRPDAQQETMGSLYVVSMVESRSAGR